MPDSTRFPRREILGILGASSVSALAGCNQSKRETETSQTGGESATSTKTIVFTDSTEDEKTTTLTTEGEPGTTVFSGGDSRAFANALTELARNPGATLEIEPGTYRLEPYQEPGAGKWRHFRPPRLENVTIDGNGATIVLTEPAAGGFYFDGGRHIEIRNLTIDYDPPPFTQGEIIDISKARRTIQVEIDEGYPLLTHEMFDGLERVGGSLHTTEGEFIRGVRKRGQLDKYYTDISQIGERRYEMTLSEFTNFRGLRAGIKQLFKARRNIAVFNLYRVANPVFENVSVRASNGAGFQFGVGDTPAVRDCVIAPPENSDRLIGIDADGVRFVNVESDPVLENTRIEYSGDDPIVVQHTLTPVSEVLDDRTVRLEEWHPFVVKPGDVLRVVSQDGTRIEALPPIAEVEYRHGDPGGRGKPAMVTFEDPIGGALEPGDVVGNKATGCHGFAIRDNTVRNVRGNLVRVAASHGIVEGNTLDGAHRNGIEIECETGTSPYAAKGGVIDVEVRNNDITRPGLNYLAGPSPSGIRVHLRTPEGVVAEGTPNRNIAIKGNRIENGAHVGIEVDHAAVVDIEANEMHDLNQLDYPDQGKFGVVLDHVTDGIVSDNLVTGSASSLSQFGVEWASEGIETENNELRIDGADKPAQLVTFEPVRLAFNKTILPEGGDLYLAIRCFRIVLKDDSGKTLRELDIGGEETAFLPGKGVYGPSQEDGESWRWVGGESETATLFLWGSDLSESSSVLLDAKPFADGVSATVSVSGQETGSIEFGTTERQTYEISVSD